MQSIPKLAAKLLLGTLCVSGGAATAWAQAPAEPATQARGDDGIAAAPEEGTRSNFIVTGVRVGGSWDDNALNSPAGNKLQDELISVEPHLALHLARPRTKASFDYTPGFTFSQEVSQYNARSQTLSGTAEHRLTRRLTLNEYNTFSLSTSAYDQFRASNLNGDVPITERPNDSAVVPGTRRTSAVAGLGASYALSPRSNLTISGSFSANRYRDLLNSSTQSLFNSTVIYGTAAYDHRMSRRRSAGVTYSAQQIWSGGESFLTHTLLYTEHFQFGAHRSLLLQGGPQYSTTSAGTASLSRSAITGGSFSWSAAATLNLQFARNSIEFSGARQVSDGGGVSSVVRLSRASVDASRNLGKSWTARVGGNYNLNDVLAGPLPLGQFRFWMANGSIVRSITRSAAIELGYRRSSHAAAQFLIGTPGYIDHNLVTVSIIYDLTHPLGK